MITIAGGVVLGWMAICVIGGVLRAISVACDVR